MRSLLYILKKSTMYVERFSMVCSSFVSTEKAKELHDKYINDETDDEDEDEYEDEYEDDEEDY